MALFLMRKWEELQEQRKEVLPKLQSLQVALRESMQKLRESEIMKLRPVEECLTDWAGLLARLAALSEEAQGCSRAQVLAVAIVSLKLLRVANNLMDAVLDELWQRQSWSGRILLGWSLLPGTMALWKYWDAITSKSVDASSQMVHGGLEEGAEWILQLVKNLKRLPAVFWGSTMCSSLVVLHATQMLGVRVLRFASKSGPGIRLLQGVSLVIGILAVYVKGLTEEQAAALRFRTRNVIQSLSPQRLTKRTEDREMLLAAWGSSPRPREALPPPRLVGVAASSASSSAPPNDDRMLLMGESSFCSLPDTSELEPRVTAGP